jgi:hypothetical protein
MPVMSLLFQRSIVILTAAVVALLFMGRCANTQTGPSGGLKDTLPPVLLKTAPPQNTVNFSGKRITLTFDEYIALKEVNKNVVISPPSLMRPVVRRSGKSIQVLFQDDSLQVDRTYIVDFGNALADNNEGNLYPPYKFIFSTGNVIDSMAFTGVLRDAYTLEPIENATVLLHENLSDSAVYNVLPSAIARTDAWGYFAVQNIAPNEYHLFAIEDKNSNYRYDPGESIAFLDSLLVPELTVSSLPVITDAKDTAALLMRPFERILLAAKENVGKQFLSEYPQTGKRQFQLVFNQRNPEILSFDVEGLDASGYVVEHSPFGDTLTYWITAEILPDTLRGVLNYMKTDSSNNLSPTEANLRFLYKEPEKPDEKPKKEGDEEKPPVLQPKIDFSQQTGMHRGVTVDFATLPVRIDTTKIALFKLNKEKKTRTPEPFRWQKDTLRLRRFCVQAAWVTVTNYELEILPEAFTDVYGLSNDSIVNPFSTPHPDKFCHITLTLSNVSAQYIVQVVGAKKDRVLREAITDKAGKILFDYLPAGEYCLRFIRDENRNRVWDPGDVGQKKQPETVVFLTLSDGSDLLQLKENTEWEQTIDMEKWFTHEH